MNRLFRNILKENKNDYIPTNFIIFERFWDVVGLFR